MVIKAFSAPAEVNRIYNMMKFIIISVLRSCGGQPMRSGLLGSSGARSPLLRRSTGYAAGVDGESIAFSAPAEVNR